ncbi:MAG: hypothetical protein V2B19_06685 [Pseudomonadota bacterium]
MENKTEGINKKDAFAGEIKANSIFSLFNSFHHKMGNFKQADERRSEKHDVSNKDKPRVAANADQRSPTQPLFLEKPSESNPGPRIGHKFNKKSGR